jgi:hypothetical protein
VSKKDTRKPPKGLCAEAVEFWENVHSRWEFLPHENDVLIVACWSLHEYHVARKILQTEGLVIRAGNLVRKHPCTEIEKNARTGFLQALKSLKLEDPSTKKQTGRPPDSGM